MPLLISQSYCRSRQGPTGSPHDTVAMRYLHLLLLSAAASLIIAGCGGGGATGSSITGAEQVMNSAGLSISAKAGAAPQMLTQSAGNITLYDFSGAAFTNVTTNPLKSIDNTNLTFGRNGQVWKIDPNGGNPTQLSSLLAGPPSSTFPAANALGRVFYSTIDQASGKYQIFVANGDGSGSFRLSDGTSNEEAPYPTVDNGSVLFGHYLSGSAIQIYKMSASGANPLSLDDGGGVDDFPSQANNGTIAFERFISGGTWQIWLMNADGSNKRLLLSDPVESFYVPRISPDGSKVLCSPQGPTDQQHMAVVPVQSPFVLTLTNPAAGVSDFTGTWSPDSREIAYIHADGVSWSIMRSTWDGHNARALFTASDALYGLNWSPYPARKALIAASGGAFGNASHGFILGQNGATIVSFVSVVSSSAGTTIAPDGISNSNANLVQRITAAGAGTITSLQYTNNQYSGPTGVPVTGAKSIAVAYDPATAEVTLVLPVASKLNAPLKLSSSFTYSGDFLGVYDRNGKNLAPSGAKLVNIDPKTGKLLSWK